MLGFSSIQKTAHRLEDAFKVLKEQDIKVDQKLETLFLEGYDTLKDLIEQLQGPFGLREEEAEKRMQASEPEFAKLQSYINHLASGAKEPATRTPATSSAKPAADFASQVMNVLKQMLQLFKQPETPDNRQKLQAHCKRLAQLGAGNKPWQGLVQVTYKAIANPKNSFATLAPVAIKELKQASDQVQAGKGAQLAPSPALQQLAVAAPAAATPATPKAKPAEEKKEKPVPATPAASAKAKQIALTVEPKTAAKQLVQAFDRPQLLQLVKLLVQATRS